jgi:hypothetical protein
MSIEILRNTPIWVWLVFIGLLALGLAQTRRRKVPRAMVFLLPAIMIALSIYSVRASFGWQANALGGWIVGAALAVLIGRRLGGSTGNARRDAAAGAYDVPGSWWPLAVMMTIFCTRFVIGVSAALRPDILVEPNFVRGISVLLGLCSGFFVARALRISGAYSRTYS